MTKVKLSTEGHVVIPADLLQARHWKAGQQLIVVETEEGVLLKSHTPYTKTTLQEVAGCLKYDGPAKSLQDFEDAIAEGIQQEWT